MVVELEIKKGWFTGIAANNREGDGSVTITVIDLAKYRTGGIYFSLQKVQFSVGF
jgi:hypothetical protein